MNTLPNARAKGAVVLLGWVFVVVGIMLVATVHGIPPKVIGACLLIGGLRSIARAGRRLESARSAGGGRPQDERLPQATPAASESGERREQD